MISCSVKWDRKLTIMNSSTSTTVLLTLLLLFLLTPGVEVGTISINERRLSQRMLHGHRRFQQPRVVSNSINGHGMENVQRPQIDSKDGTWPHVTSNGIVSAGDERSRDVLRRHTIIDHLVGFLNSLPAGGSLRDAEGARWRNMKNTIINRRMDGFITGGNEPRTIFFNSVDDWANAFQQAMKRDAVYNIGKVGGIIILYYFFPGILSWITDTFGTF